MADTAVAVDLHQPLDVEVQLAAQITFDGELPVDDLAQTRDFIFGETARAAVGWDSCAGQDPMRRGGPNAVDVGQRHPDLLFARNVNAGDTCHVCLLPLLLLMFGIGTDDHHRAFSADDLAPFTSWLNGRSNLHDEGHNLTTARRRQTF